MAGLRRGLSSFVSTIVPEKRLFIQSEGSTRYLRLTPASQLVSSAAGLALLAWLALASAGMVIDYMGLKPGIPRGVVVRDAVQARLDGLAAERDRRAAEARSAQERFQVAMEQISRQQTALLQSVEERRELSTALEVMRHRLQDAVGQRDAVAAPTTGCSQDERGQRLADQPGQRRSRRHARTVSGALSEAVAARDAATAERTQLEPAARRPRAAASRSTASARTRWSTSSSRRSPCRSGRWRSCSRRPTSTSTP